MSDVDNAADARIAEADISIDGRGFYQIQALTAKGRRFMQQVQGNDNGTAHCDDSRMTQDIADGAKTSRLHVDVNGERY